MAAKEHQEQVTLMQRIDWLLPAGIAACVYAVPNGGKRDARTAARLKAEGVRPGVPDLVIDVPALGWHGLRIELKRMTQGRTSEAQAARHAALRAQGYRVEVCRGADEAWRVLCDYLGRDQATGRVEL